MALEYFRTIKNEIFETEKILEPFLRFGLGMFENQEQFKDKNIFISVSGDDRCNTDIEEVNKTIKYYKELIDSDKLLIVNPYDRSQYYKELQSKEIPVVIEGRAEDNYKDLIQQPLMMSSVRRINNQYCFVKRFTAEPKKRYINKALSVSTNGKVYVGCSLPYKRIENEYMFDIKECNRDFFDKVEEYCFKHNICEKAHKIRERLDTYSFFERKNIPIKEMTAHDYNVLKCYDELIKAQEIIARDLHGICPTLYTDEVECMAIATVCLTTLEKGLMTVSEVQLYMLNCTELDINTIQRVDAGFLRGLILFICEKDKKRREQTELKQLEKGA